MEAAFAESLSTVHWLYVRGIATRQSSVFAADSFGFGPFILKGCSAHMYVGLGFKESRGWCSFSDGLWTVRLPLVSLSTLAILFGYTLAMKKMED